MVAQWFHETRRRHLVAERCLAVTSERLARPEVRFALGEFAMSLQDVHDQLFIPNIRQGHMVVTKEHYDRDALPLVVVKPDELVISDIVSSTPLQRQIVRQRVVYEYTMRGIRYTDEDIDRAEGLLPRDGKMELSVASIASAQCASMTIVRPSPGVDTRALIARGRPHIAVSMPIAEIMSDDVLAATMAHEEQHASSHIGQALGLFDTDPHTNYRRRLKSELSAYHVECRFLDGLSSSENDLRAVRSEPAEVEAIRHKHNGSGDIADMFVPKVEIARELVAKGLGVIFGVDDPESLDNNDNV